jgi:hypothetical protein
MRMSLTALRASAANDHGSAVVLALLATMLLGALGAGLVSMTTTEVAIAGNYRDGSETGYAAEAAAEYLVGELQRAANWSDLLSGAATLTFTDGTLTPTLASNRTISLPVMTAGLQAESDAGASRGANDPRWRLVAYGPLDRLTAGARPSPAYLAAWLADDPSDADGDPLRDTNDVVRVRARALGRAEASQDVELIVARDATSGAGRAGVRILSWRVVR